MGTDDEERIEKSSVLYKLGREAMVSDDVQEATRRLRESAQLNPHPKTLELLGECLLKSAQAKDASIALREAVAIGNRPYRALCLLGQALMNLGEREEAIACLTRALDLKPDYKAARLLVDTLQRPNP